MKKTTSELRWVESIPFGVLGDLVVSAESANFVAAPGWRDPATKIVNADDTVVPIIRYRMPERARAVAATQRGARVVTAEVRVADQLEKWLWDPRIFAKMDAVREWQGAPRKRLDLGVLGNARFVGARFRLEMHHRTFVAVRRRGVEWALSCSGPACLRGCQGGPKCVYLPGTCCGNPDCPSSRSFPQTLSRSQYRQGPFELFEPRRGPLDHWERQALLVLWMIRSVSANVIVESMDAWRKKQRTVG